MSFLGAERERERERERKSKTFRIRLKKPRNSRLRLGFERLLKAPDGMLNINEHLV